MSDEEDRYLAAGDRVRVVDMCHGAVIGRVLTVHDDPLPFDRPHLHVRIEQSTSPWAPVGSDRDLYTEFCRLIPEPPKVEPPRYRWEDVRVGDVVLDTQAEQTHGREHMRVRRVDGGTAELYVIDAPWKEHRYHRSVWDAGARCMILIHRETAPLIAALEEQATTHAAGLVRARDCKEWGSTQYWLTVGALHGNRTRGDILADEAREAGG